MSIPSKSSRVVIDILHEHYHTCIPEVWISVTTGNPLTHQKSVYNVYASVKYKHKFNTINHREPSGREVPLLASFDNCCDVNDYVSKNKKVVTGMDIDIKFASAAHSNWFYFKREDVLTMTPRCFEIEHGGTKKRIFIDWRDQGPFFLVRDYQNTLKNVYWSVEADSNDGATTQLCQRMALWMEHIASSGSVAERVLPRVTENIPHRLRVHKMARNDLLGFRRRIFCRQSLECSQSSSGVVYVE